MGGDMVVALRQASADGLALFGHNSHRSIREGQTLQNVPGRNYAWGETVCAQILEVPQARKTHTVLGCRPTGCWGYVHGVNQHRLALGCSRIRTKLRTSAPGLVGTDLVRLVLERCASARQAVDTLNDLVERYGQGCESEGHEEMGGDHVFLIADPREAFVIETTGRYWILQEIRRVRAVSDVSLIRQDWNRIAAGLAGEAIERGWWPADGSKLDFAGAMVQPATKMGSGYRRWGRATMLLEEQHGKIDAPFLRRVLSDHYEGTRDEVDPREPGDGPHPLCRHAGPTGQTATAASFVTELPEDADRLIVMWSALGPPCASVYFPILLDGELPDSFRRGEENPPNTGMWGRMRQLMAGMASSADFEAQARASLDQLQANFDRDAAAFAIEGVALKQKGAWADLARQAGYFMQHSVEQFEKQLGLLETPGSKVQTLSC